LYADSDTVLSGIDKKIYTLEDLKAGQRVTAEYGANVALSSPPQAHAVSIHVHEEGTVTEGAVYSIEPSKEGWRILLSDGNPDEEKPVLILRAKPDTMLVTRSGSPADWTQLGPGVKVKAYIPLEWLESMPPQTFPRLIVILDEELDIDPDMVKEYRELAWNFIPDSEREYILTEQDEAHVALIGSKVGSLAVQKGKERLLKEIQEKGGKLTVVTYRTERDSLLGPLQIVLDSESKELIGYFYRD
jgi:hypothetical protein